MHVFQKNMRPSRCSNLVTFGVAQKAGKKSVILSDLEENLQTYQINASLFYQRGIPHDKKKRCHRAFVQQKKEAAN